MENEQVNILLIGTDTFFSISIADYLKRKLSVEIITTNSIENGMRILDSEAVEIVIVDVSDNEVWKMIPQIQRKFKQSITIALTNNRSFLKEFETKRFMVFEKPFNLDDLVATIEKFHKKRRVI